MGRFTAYGEVQFAAGRLAGARRPGSRRLQTERGNMVVGDVTWDVAAGGDFRTSAMRVSGAVPSSSATARSWWTRGRRRTAAGARRDRDHRDPDRAVVAAVQYPHDTRNRNGSPSEHGGLPFWPFRDRVTEWALLARRPSPIRRRVERDRSNECRRRVAPPLLPLTKECWSTSRPQFPAWRLGTIVRRSAWGRPEDVDFVDLPGVHGSPSTSPPPSTSETFVNRRAASLDKTSRIGPRSRDSHMKTSQPLSNSRWQFSMSAWGPPKLASWNVPAVWQLVRRRQSALDPRRARYAVATADPPGGP